MSLDNKTNLSAILAQVNGVFIDVLDDDNVVLTPKTTAKDVADWDSLTHIQLVVAMEQSFKIRFSINEINNWKNVGDMCLSIEKHLNS